jgi:hypothetical protein
MSRIKVEVLKEARGNLYEAHEAFLKSFDSRASTDPNIINILVAITLFDPDRPNLIQRNLIRNHQVECDLSDSARRYLVKYGYLAEDRLKYIVLSRFFSCSLR